METSTILVVDDDRQIAAAIAKMLEKEGYSTLTAYDGVAAMDTLATKHVDLIIIDVMMPRMDGLSATLKIRERNNIPIIVLSAKTEDSDKVLGLSMGADDYVTKPYNPAELLARVRSHLRRFQILGSATNADLPSDAIKIGGLMLDKNAKQIVVDGEPVRLTATEYGILCLLMENKNRVFSAEQIYERVWREESFSVENTVMVHIRRIREKIEINPKQPKYLKVVWGIGYKIEG